MNKIQKITLWAGIIVIVAMGLFPPVELGTFRRGGGGGTRIPYEFLYEAENIKFTKLLIQWFIVAVITGGLIVCFKGEKDKKLNHGQKQ